jgi:LPXTG-motif cell wall-anchored protein
MNRTINRIGIATATLVAAAALSLMTAVPATAGTTFVPPTLTITNNPTVFHVNQEGTITATLTQTSQNGTAEQIYDVTENVPESFAIDSVDKGDFDECNQTGNQVECTLDASIGPGQDSETAAFTVTATPSKAGTFPDTGTYTYETPPQPAFRKTTAHTARISQQTQTPTVTDNIKVIGPSSRPSTTASATPTPTPTPTHTASHTPTHKPTSTVAATSTSTTAPTLPATGGGDVGRLAAIGGALVAIGAGATFLARRRRPASGRHR